MPDTSNIYPAQMALDSSRDQAENRWVAAIDLGGSVIKGTLAAASILDYPVRRKPRTTNDPVADLLHALSELIGEANSAGRAIVSVGIAIPGIVDETLGYVRRAVNLGVRDLDLHAVLEQEFGIPIFVGQETRCAALAERSVNEESFSQSTMMVPIGTGIGAALIVDGRLLIADGYAGEIGHFNIGSDRTCACGLTGCLETISSARAISRLYGELTGETNLDATAIAIRASDGDPAAMQTWNTAIEGLAVALAASASILGLSSIIIGGELSLAGHHLIDPLRDALNRHLSFHRRPRLSTAKLAADAGCRGAALGALAVAVQVQE